MSTVELTSTTPAAVAAGQPGWIRDMRIEAWKSYMETPLPEKNDILWKHTDPGLFLYPVRDGLCHNENGEAADTKSGKELELSDTFQREFTAGKIGGVIFNNAGRQVSSYLAPDVENSGIIIGDLAGFVNQRSELVMPYLGKLVGSDFGKFEALNAAIWQNGIFIYIPKNVVIEKPIYLMTQISESSRFVGRNIVVVEENAQLNLFHAYLGGTETKSDHMVNIATETFAGRASHFNHLIVQNLNRGSRYYFTHRTQVEHDAQTLAAFASLGAGITKANVGAILTGRGAQCDLKGFIGGHKRQHFDHFTLQDHRAPYTFSNNDFKVMVDGRARSAFRGRIRIKSDAPHSEAYQENKNMLLSEKARVESTPELEINQDEVKCSHGATIGPPDESQMFYLKSRGISDEEAIRLIVEGFMEASIRQVNGKLRDSLRNYVISNLQEN
ncbi:Fe-S cluster assembly protein SufD [candidate division KSB1 bacterium]